MNLNKYDNCKHKLMLVIDGNLAYQECETCGKILNIIYLKDLSDDDSSFLDEDLLGI